MVTGRFSCITGKVSGSSVVYRECREGCRGPSGGVSRPKGSHGLWEEINQPLVGWNKFPLRPIRFEKEKTQGGKSFQVGRWNPTPSRIGVGLLHLQFRPKLEVLRLPPPLPPSYILEVLRVFETQLCHVLLDPIPCSFSSRSYFCGARAEPWRSRSFTTTRASSRCRRTHLFLRLSCWIKKAEIIVELYVC